MGTTSSSVVSKHLFVGRTGTVWLGDGIKLPVNTGLSVPDFCASSYIDDRSRVRVVGDLKHALFICALYQQQKEKGVPASIEVCTPLICRSKAERESPVTVISSMTSSLHPPSVGGFRKLTDLDIEIFSTISSGEVSLEGANRLFAAVPFRHSLSFVNGLDATAVGLIVAWIIDPRWLVDPFRPDRHDWLFSFLGLFPDVALSVAQNDKCVTDKAMSYRAVRAAWGRGLLSVDKLEDIFALELGPRDFLLRFFRSRLNRYAPELAVLKTSQLFVKFLRLVWLSSVYKGSKAIPDGGKDLFVPELFFTEKDEVESYREHMANG